MLRLIPRDKAYFPGYREYCREFYDHNIRTFRPANPKNLDDGWFDRTRDFYLQKEQGTYPGLPKSIHYWAVDGENFIGEFQLRPDLDDERVTGLGGIGSIGYSVRLGEQGKGYGREILRQGLEIARSLGMEKVLLTIEDENQASIHVCEANGGTLVGIAQESTEDGIQLIRRYWIIL